MKILARIREVMLSPRACWTAIAAEGDATRWLWRRYLPAILLPGWLAGLVLAAFAPAEEAAVRQTAHYRR